MPLLVSGVARAQLSDVDRAAAQSLFDEGMKLMGAGRYSDACHKLEESQRIDPGMGTQYNLADCYEKTGKTASAWINFSEVADAALKEGNAEREHVARARAAALQRQLSYVTVLVPHPKEGLVVKRDGMELRVATFGVASPMDPGAHVIEASAPGSEPSQTRVDVGKDGARVEVVVPELKAVAAPEEKREFNAGSEHHTGSQQKTWALVSGGLGVVGVGIGTGLLVSAASTHSKANCDSNNVCPTLTDKSLLDTAHNRANVATVPLAIGIVGLAAGVTLWLTAPSIKDAQTPAVGPMLAPTQVGVQGRF